jgi:hypothetical protein
MDHVQEIFRDRNRIVGLDAFVLENGICGLLRVRGEDPMGLRSSIVGSGDCIICLITKRAENYSYAPQRQLSTPVIHPVDLSYDSFHFLK